MSRGKHFYAIGLSYKKADAEVRGHFSLDEQSKHAVLEQAKQNDIESLIVKLRNVPLVFSIKIWLLPKP